MAGSISLSLTQQLDQFGKPLANGKIYFIQAGTTSTPQNAYQDSALTLPWPNPIILDARGAIPQLFFSDGSIKIRLTDANGVNQLVADGILVVGASSGGGGGSPVDATTVLATGDLKVRYGTGVLAGFVRANGRTIGSASSGSTERANADTQVLYEYLWNTDVNLVVSSGRGVSSIADWTANKTIALPDWRGRALAALDDMGNSAAGRLTATYFGASTTTLGAGNTGLDHATLTAANLPPITSANAAQAISVLSGRTYPAVNTFIDSLNQGSGNAVLFWRPNSSQGTEQINSTGNNSISVTSTGTTSTPFATVQPTMLATVYLKL